MSNLFEFPVGTKAVNECFFVKRSGEYGALYSDYPWNLFIKEFEKYGNGVKVSIE